MEGIWNKNPLLISTGRKGTMCLEGVWKLFGRCLNVVCEVGTGQLKLGLVKSSQDRSNQFGTSQSRPGQVNSSGNRLTKKILWTQNLFGSKKFLDPKFLLAQPEFVEPCIFWTIKVCLFHHQVTSS